MQQKWLVLEITGNVPGNSKVWLKEEPPRPEAGIKQALRFSPVFPIATDNKGYVIAQSGSFHLGFYVLRKPSAAVALLNSTERQSLFFSLGLASLVSIAPNHELSDQLREKWKSDLIAWEAWNVVAGVLQEPTTLQLPDVANLDEKSFLLSTEGVTDRDINWILTELQHNLKRFAACSALVLPSNLLRCNLWVSSIQGIIDELREQFTAVSSIQRKQMDANSVRQTLQMQKSIHANTDLLIHINSALVYAITQAFHGTVPIQATLPLISHHSLLGVGSAWVALRNLCAFVESVFQRYPVQKIIDSEFASLPWRDLNQVDKSAFDYARDVSNPNPIITIRPKITSFSSRLGFGEIDFTATCAPQTLYASASSRHNMMTMSHELLHAHVKVVMLAAFRSGVATDRSTEDAICDTHEEWLKWKDKRIDDGSLRLIHTLRFAIVEYVGRYKNCLALAEHYRAFGAPPVEETTNTKGRSMVPISAADFRTAFRTSYRFLEEIFVHTLDFYYFYNGQTDLYIDAIWSSWSTVPSVLSRLEWYILRTLAPIATTIPAESNDSNISYRLEQSRAILRSRLNAMAQDPSYKAVAEAAIGMLDDDRIRKWITYMFIPAVKLADLAKTLLCDKRIAQALWGSDEFIEWRDERMTYLLDPMSFDEQVVANPVAFLMARLAAALESPDALDNIGEAELSAWMSFTLSNHDVPSVKREGIL